MKIGIIGSGDVAQSLGQGMTVAGHEVMLGSRTPDKPELLALTKASGDKIQVGTNAQAAAFGEVVVLAVKGTAVADVVAVVQEELKGKTVIDVTNPLVFSDQGPPGLSVGHDNSGGEITQKLLPDSNVVKTLNTISHTHMAQPVYKQGTPVMFMAGNDAAAKAQVRNLLHDLGWEDISDLGGIEVSRLLEPLCLLWVQYGMVNSTWGHAFAVLLQ